MRKLNKFQREWFEDFPNNYPQLYAEMLAELYGYYAFGDWTIDELISLLKQKQKDASEKLRGEVKSK